MFHWLPEPAALADKPAEVPEKHLVPVFDAKSVSIFYGSFRAVTDVSLTIYELEITAFIGSSGSGKSRVLRAFNGIRKKSHLDEIVESSLRKAALWDEVKNRLGASGLGLSGGVLVNPDSDTRTSVLIEYGPTQQIFEDPHDSRTEAYVTGRIG